MSVNIQNIINQWVENKGITKKSIVNYLGISEPAFYAKLKNNRIYLHETESLAAFFGVSLIEFLQGKAGLKTYISDPPGLYASNKEEQIKALKKEIGYLKQIIDLQNKTKK